MRRNRLETTLNADTAFAEAAELLAKRGIKFTAIRRAVFELLCRESKAVGAYALVSAMEKESGRRIAPQTVYRTLEILEAEGLVAHLPNTKSYVARLPHKQAETSLFFVCSKCGLTVECQDSNVGRAVRSSANAIGFASSARVIDLAGMCKQCSVSAKVIRKPERSISKTRNLSPRD